MRAAFADSGSHEALLRTLRGLKEHGHTMNEEVREIFRGYLDDGGPFPERLHLNVLVGKFIFEYTSLLERWADWAESEVEQWDTTGPADTVPVAWQVLYDALGHDYESMSGR